MQHTNTGVGLIDWSVVDTVLLDMDGTLLDLHYDNVLWNHALPQRFASATGRTVDGSRAFLLAHMQAIRASLDFYCLDYWATFTGVDIISLHHEHAHLIGYRADAATFLDWLRDSGTPSLIVTNAHPGSIAVKHTATGVMDRVAGTVSCHDYGYPKEALQFWDHLARHHPFDPDRTLLIDDNAAVLHAAERFGIAHVLSISVPDSNQPPRKDLTFRSIDRFLEILPDE